MKNYRSTGDPSFASIKPPPERSKTWELRVFPDVVFYPLRDAVPNLFQRKMQEMVFGVKWVKLGG